MPGGVCDSCRRGSSATDGQQIRPLDAIHGEMDGICGHRMSVTMPLLTEGIHCCAAGVGAVNQSVGGHDIDRDVHPPQCVSGTHTARTMDRHHWLQGKSGHVPMAGDETSSQVWLPISLFNYCWSVPTSKPICGREPRASLHAFI